MTRAVSQRFFHEQHMLSFFDHVVFIFQIFDAATILNVARLSFHHQSLSVGKITVGCSQANIPEPQRRLGDHGGTYNRLAGRQSVAGPERLRFVEHVSWLH